MFYPQCLLIGDGLHSWAHWGQRQEAERSVLWMNKCKTCVVAPSLYLVVQKINVFFNIGQCQCNSTTPHHPFPLICGECTIHNVRCHREVLASSIPGLPGLSLIIYQPFNEIYNALRRVCIFWVGVKQKEIIFGLTMDKRKLPFVKNV